ncbi:hypothetical protein N7533_000824 [Penicillium manginii]|uniref:uncharacterized protein n=1 Tax=Penicillium manginii TaxID=203109 RepID=UPI002546A4B0|nr:uncharacterized protein N7533_000824 [Penicillium manginii]KAJ5768241.1 hypothetical protein N7533_000824 [Penicillium manginii]
MDLDHLIIVCCHAIYIGGPLSGSSEDEWIIEPFQRAETPTFVSHAKAGLNALMEDDRGLLVFSGYVMSYPNRANEKSENGTR